MSSENASESILLGLEKKKKKYLFFLQVQLFKVLMCTRTQYINKILDICVHSRSIARIIRYNIKNHSRVFAY